MSVTIRDLFGILIISSDKNEFMSIAMSRLDVPKENIREAASIEMKLSKVYYKLKTK